TARLTMLNARARFSCNTLTRICYPLCSYVRLAAGCASLPLISVPTGARCEVFDKQNSKVPGDVIVGKDSGCNFLHLTFRVWLPALKRDCQGVGSGIISHSYGTVVTTVTQKRNAFP